MTCRIRCIELGLSKCQKAAILMLVSVYHHSLAFPPFRFISLPACVTIRSSDSYSKTQYNLAAAQCCTTITGQNVVSVGGGNDRFCLHGLLLD